MCQANAVPRAMRPCDAARYAAAQAAGVTRHTRGVRKLLACGVLAGPLFVTAFLIEGATRPGYNALRHPISSLAIGDLGWTQSANFLVAGLLTVAYALGVRRASGSTWGSLLIAASGVAFIGAAIFVTDPISGYPPGTPDRLQYTQAGALHQLLSTLYFVGLPAACFVMARKQRGGWAAYSVVSGLLFIVAFVLAAAGFGQAPGLVDFGGLFQRIAVIDGELWLSLLAVYFLRETPSVPSSTHSAASASAAGAKGGAGPTVLEMASHHRSGSDSASHTDP